MKIYIVHSNSFDYKNNLYIPIRNSKLNLKHDIIFPHETNEFINSTKTIQNADLIIDEVSYPSTGMGIELGYAESLNKKIACIYKKNSKIPDRYTKFQKQSFLTKT